VRNDPLRGADLAQPFVKQLPNAELELMAGASHAVWIDDRDHAATATRRSWTAHRGGLPAIDLR